MLQDLPRDAAFALIDPTGDLAQTVADTVPPERIAYTIYVDPLDETPRRRLQSIARGSRERERLPPRFVSTFKASTRQLGPNLDDILYNAVGCYSTRLARRC